MKENWQLWSSHTNWDELRYLSQKCRTCDKKVRLWHMYRRGS
jgi:hypothetical protein